MSNLRRLQVSDRIFFVTVNLRKTVPRFTASEFPLIIQALEESRRRLRFLLCGYVLMPDHWHALIWPVSPLTISAALHDLKRAAAHKLHRQRGTSGPVWQHQFWDRFVRHAKEFHQRLEYMHLNPVRKGLVGHPKEWPWSSYNHFAVDSSRVSGCPITIDDVQVSPEYRG